MEKAYAATITKAPSNLGLVGYWSFNEGVGTKAGDSSGSGNTGTLTNMDAGTDWVAGKRGKALDFDGSNDYIEIADAPVLDMSSSFSVSAWVYPRSLLRTNTGDWNTILGKGDDGETSSVNHNYMLGYNGSSAFGAVDRWVFLLENSSGTNCNVVGNVAAGLDQWYLVSGVFNDTANSVEIFVNGISQGSVACALTPNLNNIPLKIGDDDNIDSLIWDGKIDDVRIYNRALTSTEITNIYRSGQVVRKGVSNQGLVGYWSFNDGVGIKAGDSSGNGNTGTLTNMDAGTDWVAGKRGKALDFDGIDDYVIVASSTALDIETVTVSTWIKTSQTPSFPGVILEKWNSTFSPNRFPYALRLATNGSVEFVASDGSSIPVANPGNAVNDNAWHHVVGVREKGSSLSVYIDGAFATSTADTTIGSTTNSSVLGMGLRPTGGVFPGVYEGKIDDVRVYNRALSAAEIQTLYRMGETKVNSSQNSRLTDGLVGLWSFNGNDMNNASTTAEVLDRSGNGNNGDAQNGAKAAIGKVGQAMAFNGSSGNVQVQSSSVLNMGTGDFSVSAWVKGNNLEASDVIIAKSNGGSAASDYGFLFGVFTGALNPRLYYATAASLHTSLESAAGLSNNKWYHLVAVVDRDNASNCIIYVDGVATSTTVNNIESNTGSIANSYTLTMGSESDGSFYWDGLLDEVRMYNRILSADEVKQLYNMGK